MCQWLQNKFGEQLKFQRVWNPWCEAVSKSVKLNTSSCLLLVKYVEAYPPYGVTNTTSEVDCNCRKRPVTNSMLFYERPFLPLVLFSSLMLISWSFLRRFLIVCLIVTVAPRTLILFSFLVWNISGWTQLVGKNMYLCFFTLVIWSLVVLSDLIDMNTWRDVLIFLCFVDRIVEGLVKTY
jgi:hypothetical protein